MSRRRSQQRGVALLTAVVLVALATVVATAIAFDTTLAARRGGGGAAFDEAAQIAGGAEATAALAISTYRSQGATSTIHAEQEWARPIGPVEVVPGAMLEANVVDLQGRFNLNDLTTADGAINTEAVEVFERLLQHLEVRPEFASMMADWIDDDDQPAPNGGAEGSVYSSESPPYRPPNRVITSPTELLALKGFTVEDWRKLAPFVTALPRGIGVNLCTASAPLIDALTKQNQWTNSPDALKRQRSGKCFPDVATFEAMVGDPQYLPKLKNALAYAETSNWFQVRTLATIGTSEFALYSLLRYEPQGASAGGRVSVVTRTFTE